MKTTSLTLLMFLLLLTSFFLILPQFGSASQNFETQSGDGVLTLHNLHLQESLEVKYRNTDGSYDVKALEKINHLLRCRQTLKTHEMNADLIELVDAIQDHFGGKEVQVISGYRSPELNNNLRSQGRAVAQKSLHMSGLAIDIRIPGVSTSTLREFAYSLRKGGVGYYPHDGFVHVDVGRFRTW